MSRAEPILIRCCRCDALIALADASRCEIHQTDPLCPYCWKHHWMTQEKEKVNPWEECWSLVPFQLEWIPAARRTRT